MIGLLAFIFFLVAAGKIWGGWGVVLALCGLILIGDATSEKAK